MHVCMKIEWGETRYGIKESPHATTKKSHPYMSIEANYIFLCRVAKLSVQRLEGTRGVISFAAALQATQNHYIYFIQKIC